MLCEYAKMFCDQYTWLTVPASSGIRPPVEVKGNQSLVVGPPGVDMPLPGD